MGIYKTRKVHRVVKVHCWNSPRRRKNKMLTCMESFSYGEKADICMDIECYPSLDLVNPHNKT